MICWHTVLFTNSRQKTRKTLPIPQLEVAIEEYGKIRMLLYLDMDFQGWEAGTAWDDANFGMKYRNNFNIMAVVSGPAWVEWPVQLAAHLMHGEMKSFTESELAAAVIWIKK